MDEVEEDYDDEDEDEDEDNSTEGEDWRLSPKPGIGCVAKMDS